MTGDTAIETTRGKSIRMTGGAGGVGRAHSDVAWSCSVTGSG